MLHHETKLARQLFPPDCKRPVAVNHRPSKDDISHPAQNWFTQVDFPAELIGQLLSTEACWRHPGFAEVDLYALPFSEVRTQFQTRLSPLYDGASLSLDGIRGTGFNRHDEYHVSTVDLVSQRLLDLAETSWNAMVEQKTKLRRIDDAARKRTLIGVWGHDLGNLFSRDLHALISPDILAALYPRLLSDPRAWRLIRRIIKLHNEPVAEALLAADLWKENPQANTEDLLLFLREHFGPESLAVIIADKIDVGPHRISRKPQDKQGLLDQHLELNLLGRTTGINLSADGKELSWELAFDLRIDEAKSELHRFCRQGNRGQGRRAMVSPQTRKSYLQAESPQTYFESWHQEFWRINFKRNVLAIRAMFALFPEVEIVKVRSLDAERGVEKLLFFRKTYLDQDFQTVSDALFSPISR